MRRPSHVFPRALFAAFAFIFLCSTARAQIANDRAVTIHSEEDVAAKRQQLIEFIWGPEGLPRRRMPRLPVLKNDVSPISGMADLERVDTLTVDMEAGVKSYAHHFIPKIKNNRLVILHSGHFATFNDSDVPADEGFGMRRTIEGLLGDGYSVLAVYMPRNAEFTTSIEISDDGGIDAHNALFSEGKYRPKAGSPLKYFLEPIAVYLNYLSSRASIDNFPEYKDLNMVGFSGGGWTTTVYAAIDPRINLSVAIAGSMPLYLRSGAAVGDAEQTVPEFYAIAGYPDLYVLGSHGIGRKQIQVLNRNDWCCFSQVHHDWKLARGLTFDESVREYESTVREALIEIGNSDLFSVQIDEAAPGHNVTWDAIYGTILLELSEGRRTIATATGGEAVARGLRGMPSIFINGIWSPAKLSAMTGTAALLRSAANPFDLFYRNASNELVYTYRPPQIWSRPQVLLSNVIGDPAAASRGPGRFDVVALRNDYLLYHISRVGAETTVSPISKQIKGIGQPILLASGRDRLDIFYKSMNRRLYHAWKVGDAPWTVEEVGGRMVDMPTAVRLADGSFRVFVKGLDGGLWESRRGNGLSGEWSSWVSVSAQTGTGPVDGSPSAAIVDGELQVYSRLPEGGMRKFQDSQGWNYIDQPGHYAGSPTASSGGIFARSPEGSLAFSNGDKWTLLGGSLD